MNRGEHLDEVIARHRPADAWAHASEWDWWALITHTPGVAAEPFVWLRTFQTRGAADAWVRDDLRRDEVLVALTDLGTGEELLPVLVWVRPECSWPTCGQRPSANGRQFLGGAMCQEHSDETWARDRAASEAMCEVPRW